MPRVFLLRTSALRLFSSSCTSGQYEYNVSPSSFGAAFTVTVNLTSPLSQPFLSVTVNTYSYGVAAAANLSNATRVVSQLMELKFSKLSGKAGLFDAFSQNSMLSTTGNVGLTNSVTVSLPS